MAKFKLQYFLGINCPFSWTALATCPLLPQKLMGTFLISEMLFVKTNYLGTLTLQGLQSSAISDDCLKSFTGPAINNKTFNKHRKLYQASQFVQKRLSKEHVLKPIHQ